MMNRNKILIITIIFLIIGGVSAKTGNTIIGDSITNVLNISAERGDFNALYEFGERVVTWVNVSGQPKINQSVTFIPGENIGLSQDTNNRTITITGAATWSLSNLDVDHINITSGGYVGLANDSTYENLIQFLSVQLWLYSYQKSTNLIGQWNIVPNHIYAIVCSFGSGDCLNHEIDIYDNVVQIHAETSITGNTAVTGNTSITGNLNLNGENINTTLQKSKQMAFEVNLNTSGIAINDTVLIPYDFYLTNVSTFLDNNTGYINYSIIKYSNYPSGYSEIATINTSAYLNKTNVGNPILNQDDIVVIDYNNFSIVTTAVILFELQRI